MSNYIVINGVKYAPVEKGQIVICDKDCDLYNKCIEIDEFLSTEGKFCYVDTFNLKLKYQTMKKVE